MPYKDPIKAREASRKSSLKYYYNHTPTPEQEARRKIARKAWEIKNASKLSDYQHKRWLRDKDKISLRKKNYKMEHPDLIKEQKAQNYLKHREQRIASVKRYTNKNWGAIKETKRKYQQSPKGRLRSYIVSAKVRGYEFNLSTEDFNKLLLENCHYCGKLNANGVDRKNSDIGYFAENVVSCCRTCNYMKRDLSYQEFKEHIKKIHSHLVNEKNLLSGRFEHRVFLTS